MQIVLKYILILALSSLVALGCYKTSKSNTDDETSGKDTDKVPIHHEDSENDGRMVVDETSVIDTETAQNFNKNSETDDKTDTDQRIRGESDTSEYVDTNLDAAVVESTDSNVYSAPPVSVHIACNSNYATNKSGRWVVEKFDRKWSGTYIALDSNGKVHMVVESYRGFMWVLVDGPTYITNASGSWVSTVLDDNGLHTSIAIDSSDNVHISYVAKIDDITRTGQPGSQGYLTYANNKNGVWDKEDLGYVVSNSTSLALDLSGNAHIAYSSDTREWYLDALYSTNSRGSWETERLNEDNDEHYGIGSLLVLDSEGHDHVIFGGGDGDESILYYATNKSGRWTMEQVDTGTWLGQFVSIAIDLEDRLHVAYISLYDSGIRYATRTNDTWKIETIFEEELFDTSISIAVDSLGKAHISCLYEKETLMYITNSSGSWTMEPVDTESCVNSSIAVFEG